MNPGKSKIIVFGHFCLLFKGATLLRLVGPLAKIGSSTVVLYSTKLI